MDRTSRLFSALAELGITPKMQTFAERKRVQKTIYLLDKVFEMNFRYSYSWYLHGPYSPQVTQILFNVVEGHQNVDVNSANLSREDHEKVNLMKSFLKEDLYSNDKLELLVSVHYMLECISYKNSKEQEIIEFINEKKPYFTNRQIVEAINRIKSLRKQLVKC
jgi:uncharacterized protein YwgA